MPVTENGNSAGVTRGRRRNLTRKNYASGSWTYGSKSYSKQTNVRRTLHDSRGFIQATDVDLCDCLDITCPGCHFPCPKCQSPKCGHECRVSRKYIIERVEDEGVDITVTNEYATKG